jgi:ferrochelatase
MTLPACDAVLLVSFGGPEGMDDVQPFLANVLRGRPVPAERIAQVARHYERFGGVSPLNAQNRALLAALEAELAARGPRLPLYWGNRNWHPLLSHTLSRMAADGVRRALAFVTSAFSSYSGCRQYLEDIARAQAALGPTAPLVEKLRVFYDHPGFVAAHADRVREALAALSQPEGAARLVFTAHSIPIAMAQMSEYESQLREACRLVADAVGHGAWHLAFQSRSGPPSQRWLEPDISDCLRELAQAGVREVVVSPIGFVSDHLEVVYDLDVEAADLARSLGLNLRRAGTPGTHPAFVSMIRELILERTEGLSPRRLSRLPPPPAECAADCCPRGGREAL